MAPPLGELASSEAQMTERARLLTESRYPAIGTSLGQSDAIAVFAALTLPGSPSQLHFVQQLPQRGSHWRAGGGPADRAKLVQCGNGSAPLSRFTGADLGVLWKAAAANEDRARYFAPHWAQANSTACPTCQWLPLWGQRRRPPPAAETGRSCWGSGQQDASAAQGTKRMLGAATRSWREAPERARTLAVSRNPEQASPLANQIDLDRKKASL